MDKAGEALSMSTSSSSSLSHSDADELQKMSLNPPRPRPNTNKRLAKQLSMPMRETKRDVAWERRRRQILLLERKRNKAIVGEGEDLTDEDLRELKGSIELGFGFNEEEGGQKLTGTLPALDLYFAVNRKLSPVSTPGSRGSASSSSPFGSPRSESDVLKIASPGDNPEQVKTRLRHWAQAVACSVMQTY